MTLCRSTCLLLAALCVPLAVSSCVSPKFEHRWRQATAPPQQQSIVGAWDGSWTSDVNGHHGRLRCIVGPDTDRKGTHPFHYRATWMKILSGGYQTEHAVTATGPGQFAFSGTHRLPDWAGGLYTYQGVINNDTLSVRYQCAIDEGRYDLKRQPPFPPQP